MTAYLSTAWQDHLLTVLEFEKIHVVREDTQTALHCYSAVIVILVHQMFKKARTSLNERPPNAATPDPSCTWYRASIYPE